MVLLKDEWTSIRVKNQVHQNLLKLKIHPNESFNDVIVRLMGEKEEV